MPTHEILRGTAEPEGGGRVGRYQLIKLLALTVALSTPSEKVGIGPTLVEIWDVMITPQTGSEGVDFHEPLAHRLASLCTEEVVADLSPELVKGVLIALYLFIQEPLVPHLPPDATWRWENQTAKYYLQNKCDIMSSLVELIGHADKDVAGWAWRCLGAFCEGSMPAVGFAVSQYNAYGKMIRLLRDKEKVAENEVLRRGVTYFLSVCISVAEEDEEDEEGGFRFSPDQAMEVLEVLWEFLENDELMQADHTLLSNIMVSFRVILPSLGEVPEAVLARLIDILGWAPEEGEEGEERKDEDEEESEKELSSSLLGDRYAKVLILTCLREVFSVHSSVFSAACDQTWMLSYLIRFLRDEHKDLVRVSLSLVRLMASKNMFGVLLSQSPQSDFVNQLVFLLVRSHDLYIQEESVKIIHHISKAGSSYAAKLTKMNAAPSLFRTFKLFKYHDTVMSEVYGTTGPCYNIDIVVEACDTLVHMLRSHDPDKQPHTAFLESFSAEAIDDIAQFHFLICKELSKGHLAMDEELLGLTNSLSSLVNLIKQFHEQAKTPSASEVRTAALELLEDWSEKLNNAIEGSTAEQKEKQEIRERLAELHGAERGMFEDADQSAGFLWSDPSGDQIVVEAAPTWGLLRPKLFIVPNSATFEELRTYLELKFGMANLQMSLERDEGVDDLDLSHVYGDSLSRWIVTSDEEEGGGGGGKDDDGDEEGEEERGGRVRRKDPLKPAVIRISRPSSSFNANIDQRDDYIDQALNSQEKNQILSSLRRDRIQVNESLANDIFNFMKERDVSVLNVDQFAEAMASFELSFEEVQSLYTAFDVDGNGELSFEEIVAGFAILKTGTMEAKLEYVFRAFDQDQSGDIDQDELFELFRFVLGNDDLARRKAATICPDHPLDFDTFLARMKANRDIRQSFWLQGFEFNSKLNNNKNRQYQGGQQQQQQFNNYRRGKNNQYRRGGNRQGGYQGGGGYPHHRRNNHFNHYQGR